MKICIVTFWGVDNLGAVLQTFALQSKLKELFQGDEVFVVPCKRKVWEHNHKTFRLYFRKKLYKLFWYYLYQFFWMPDEAACIKKFNTFRAMHFALGCEDQNRIEYTDEIRARLEEYRQRSLKFFLSCRKS